MATLDRAPEVVRMARELGLDHRTKPSAEILAFCIRRIQEWLKDFQDVGSIAKVQRIVCAKLRLKVEEVHADSDIEKLTEKYAVQKGDGAFAHLAKELNADTFAVLMQRKHATASDPDQFVTVIDCRGAKAKRKFFTIWHEIAHMLTLYEQLQLPLHRSRGSGSPLERLMDMIAGEVGFYDPIFEPMLHAALQKHGGLCFAAVEEIQSTFCPGASFQATLIACVKRSPMAGAYIEVGLGLKKCEEQLVASGQGLLAWEGSPRPKLRVLNSSSNAAGKSAGILFHRNMEVPSCSHLFHRFRGMEAQPEPVRENLKLWTHSDGSHLGHTAVRLETRPIQNALIGLVTP
jgi:hypothetical protein